LNAINSQWWLVLAASLVLAAEKPAHSRYSLAVNSTILVLAALSGPAAVFLAPLFFIRAIIERQYLYVIYSGVLASGAVVLAMGQLGGQGRPLDFPLDIFAISSLFQIFINNICIYCSDQIFSAAVAVNSLPLACLIVVVLSAIMLALSKHVSTQGRWMISSALMLLVFPFFGALGKEYMLTGFLFNGRYFFVPTTLLIGSILFVNAGIAKKTSYIFLLMFFLNGLIAAIYIPISGETDGLRWRHDVSALAFNEDDIVYFSYPVCAFSPNNENGKQEAVLTFLGLTDGKLILAAPKFRSSRKNNLVFVYRAKITDDKRGKWELFDNGWKETNFFLFGTEKFGLCYGGDQPVNVDWVQDSKGRLVIDVVRLGDLADYIYLVGYGETFATMLAHKSYIQFFGKDILATPLIINQ